MLHTKREEVMAWRATAPGEPVFRALMDDGLLGFVGVEIIHQREVRRRGLVERYRKLSCSGGRLISAPCDVNSEYQILNACLMGALRARDMERIALVLNMIAALAGILAIPRGGLMDIVSPGGYHGAGPYDWSTRPTPGSGLFRSSSSSSSTADAVRVEIELRKRRASVDLSAMSLDAAAHVLARTVAPPVFLFRPLLLRCVAASMPTHSPVLVIDVACLIEGDLIVDDPDNTRWVEETALSYGGQRVMEWKPRGLMFTVELDDDDNDKSHV